MDSYLVGVNQSCLEIIKIYKKMKFSNDNCILALVSQLLSVLVSLVLVRWISICAGGKSNSRIRTKIGGPSVGGPDSVTKIIRNTFI